MTPFAAWLDEEFAGFDHTILTFLHNLAAEAGSILTPFMTCVSFFGEKGITVFLWGLFCVLYRDIRQNETPKVHPLRKIGLGIWGAMGFGTVTGNFVLKNIIRRPRPMCATGEYRQFWVFVGSLTESGYSFPSGHVMAASAGVTAALWLTKNPKFAWLYIYVFILALSRCYLLAHYPTDVLGGVLLGGISGILSGVCIRSLYRKKADLPHLYRYLI